MYHFQKSRRLLQKKEYQHVFAQAKKLVTTEFILLYRNNTLDHARLGLALSKKTIAKAHDRNRLKRLLREAFRTQNNLPALDMIFLARIGAGRVHRSIVAANLAKLWQQVRAIGTVPHGTIHRSIHAETQFNTATCD